MKFTLIHFYIDLNPHIDLIQMFMDYLHYSYYLFFIIKFYNYCQIYRFIINLILKYLIVILIIIFYLFHQ